jgi:glyoxylase-like metal-dependent hydrolase (beta-lactamase superfamily II)
LPDIEVAIAHHPMVKHYGCPPEAMGLVRAHRVVESGHRRDAWQMVLTNAQGHEDAVLDAVEEAHALWLMYRDDVCRAAWASFDDSVLAGRPLRRVFVTHDHPDHMGLASWLTERYGAEVWMSAWAHESSQRFLATEPEALETRGEAFLRKHGMEIAPKAATPARDPRAWFGGRVRLDGQPGDGSVLQMGGGRWRIIETAGHCRGHLCLHDGEREILISGDQVLPEISPNVSVLAMAPEADPLRDFLTSLDRLHACSVETLVLPSHGRPFRGLQRRIDALRSHHHQQLDMLRDHCREPRSANDLLPVMFGRVLRGVHRLLALGEALAHLHYLRSDGEVERIETDGVYRFVTV